METVFVDEGFGSLDEEAMDQALRALVDLLELPGSEMRKIWGAKITMVHQDPNTAVNPSIVIGEQIAVSVHDATSVEAARRVLRVFGVMAPV